MVTSFNPLEAWIYDGCYLRFSGINFNSKVNLKPSIQYWQIIEGLSWISADLFIWPRFRDVWAKTPSAHIHLRPSVHKVHRPGGLVLKSFAIKWNFGQSSDAGPTKNQQSFSSATKSSNFSLLVQKIWIWPGTFDEMARYFQLKF